MGRRATIQERRTSAGATAWRAAGDSPFHVKSSRAYGDVIIRLRSPALVPNSSQRH
jgi:hypothetical protein